jgi:hypothetical protein
MMILPLILCCISTLPLKRMKKKRLTGRKISKLKVREGHLHELFDLDKYPILAFPTVSLLYVG